MIVIAVNRSLSDASATTVPDATGRRAAAARTDLTCTRLERNAT
jgi:hypothetical protein